MSDFLRHLTARSFTGAPSLRPRLAGLFEPPAGGAAPVARDMEGQRKEDATFPETVVPDEGEFAGTDMQAGAHRKSPRGDRSVLERREPETNPRRDEADSAGNPSREAATGRDQPLPSPANPPAAPLQSAKDLPRTERDKPGPIQRAIPAEAALQPTLPRIAPPALAVEKHFEHTRTVVEKAASDQREKPASTVAPSGRDLRVERRLSAPADEDRSAALFPRSAREARLIAPTPPSFARERERTRIADMTAREIPEPSIHVSIGRIEIKAELPETPARRTAPRHAAGISLEDYLRGKSAREAV